MARVDPFLHPIPRELLKNPETRAFFEYLVRFLHDIWKRTGGGNDLIDQGDFGDLNSATGYQDISEEGGEIINRLFEQQADFPLMGLQHEPPYLPDIENISRFIGDLGDPFPQVELAAGSTSLTTTGSQLVVCNNTAAATVTLNSSPAGGEEVIIARRNAAVTVSGSINGGSSSTLLLRYDTAHLMYSIIAGEWIIK